MKFFKKNTQIDFMNKRRLALIFSVLVLIVAIFSLFTRGLSLGIDFTGGTLVELGYPEKTNINQVRNILKENGFNDFSVQQFGTNKDILIRLPQMKGGDAKISNRVFKILNEAANGTIDLRRVEFVGPQIGEELTEDGALAMLVALIAILVYVALRFEWKFAIGSVIALIHDVVFTIGLFSIFQIEFDLPVLAAVLAVIGYSLNDTIVVYDRVRENFRKMRKGTSEEIINTSLNHTLSRTLVTSLTTILVLLALYFLGGEIIHGFAIALLVGSPWL